MIDEKSKIKNNRSDNYKNATIFDFIDDYDDVIIDKDLNKSEFNQPEEYHKFLSKSFEDLSKVRESHIKERNEIRSKYANYAIIILLIQIGVNIILLIAIGFEWLKLPEAAVITYMCTFVVELIGLLTYIFIFAFSDSTLQKIIDVQKEIVTSYKHIGTIVKNNKNDSAKK